MWVGLLTDEFTNKREKGNLINAYASSHEPVPLKQPSIEQIWSKTKPREVREPKIWRLEDLHSNPFVAFFVVKVLPP